MANGEADEPDIAPNLDAAKRFAPEDPPKSGVAPPAVAKGDLVDVFANPLPDGIYI